MPLALLALSVTLYVGGAVASLVLPECAASRAAAISGVLGALAGIAASLPVIDGHAVTATLFGPFPFAHFVVRLDPLAALMVLTISLLAAATAVFGSAYVEEEYAGRGIGAMGFFMNLFIASMLLVVVADNGMWFIVFFEMMKPHLIFPSHLRPGRGGRQRRLALFIDRSCRRHADFHCLFAVVREDRQLRLRGVPRRGTAGAAGLGRVPAGLRRLRR